MAFHDRDAQRLKGVEQGHRGVTVAGGVDDERRGLFAGFLDPVDQLALVIGLAEHHGRAVGDPFAQGADVIQRLAAIDVRLAHPKQVEVGAVQDVEDGGFGHSLEIMTSGRADSERPFS